MPAHRIGYGYIQRNQMLEATVASSVKLYFMPWIHVTSPCGLWLSSSTTGSAEGKWHCGDCTEKVAIPSNEVLRDWCDSHYGAEAGRSSRSVGPWQRPFTEEEPPDIPQ